MATTVVPWVISWGVSPRGTSAQRCSPPARLSTSRNDGPGSSSARKVGRVIGVGGYRLTATPPVTPVTVVGLAPPNATQALPVLPGSACVRGSVTRSERHATRRLLAALLDIALDEVF